MLASALITLREGLEAALIVGIALSVLRHMKRSDQAKAVWAGVAVALIVSVAAGLAFNLLGLALEGRSEAVFEGLAMLLAAAVLTWMIFWMQQQGRQVEMRLKQDVRRAVAIGDRSALFGLAFVAVLREGMETALFLTAAAFSATSIQVLVGGALGLALAVGLGWLVFTGSRRLDVRVFFRLTGILLLLFAAGLIAQAVHEFQEAALLPTLVKHIWNINPILSEESTVGVFLKALFGYDGNPSLLQVLAYSAYCVAVGAASLQRSRKRARAAEANV